MPAIQYSGDTMGKGDKRSFRGKLFKGSHGKTRPQRTKKTTRKTAKRAA